MAWSVGAGLEGRGVILTGATGGIGAAVARGFAAAGAKVMAVDLDQGRLDELVGSLEGTGHVGVVTDLRDLSTHAPLVERAVAELGGVYVLANLAAVLRRRGSLDEVTEDDWDRVLDVNLKGVFFCAQAVGREMVRCGSGKIINMASQNGVVGYHDRAAYCSSKAGVVNLTRVLAIEWAEHQINVNAVAPTFVLTPLTEKMFANPSFSDEIHRRIPLGRLGKPEDIVGAVVFLASPAADLITGHTLLVDGGWTAI